MSHFAIGHIIYLRHCDPWGQ